MNPILILNFPKNEKTSFDSTIGTITFSNKTYTLRIIIENDEKQWIFSYKKENLIIYRTRITIKCKFRKQLRQSEGLNKNRTT